MFSVLPSIYFYSLRSPILNISIFIIHNDYFCNLAEHPYIYTYLSMLENRNFHWLSRTRVRMILSACLFASTLTIFILSHINLEVKFSIWIFQKNKIHSHKASVNNVHSPKRLEIRLYWSKTILMGTKDISIFRTSISCL